MSILHSLLEVDDCLATGPGSQLELEQAPRLNIGVDRSATDSEGIAPDTVGDELSPSVFSAMSDPPQASPAPAFHAHHLKYLLDRAIDPALAWQEGVRSLSEEDVRRYTGNDSIVGTALGFAYGRVLIPYVRAQLDDREANKCKTMAPAGVTPPPYIPNAVSADGAEQLFIVEAPAKALSMVSNGFSNTIGCGGVNAGIFEKGSSKLQAVLLPFLRPSRPVYVAFDGGRSHKAQVARAEARIARALMDHGCPVFLVEIPADPDNDDLGPDDFLARHGREAMCALVSAARPADAVAWTRLAVSQGAAAARALFEHMPFLAAVDAGGAGVASAVAAELKAYFGKSDLRRAVSEFRVASKVTTSRPGSAGVGSPVLERGDEAELADVHRKLLGEHAVHAEGDTFIYRAGVWRKVQRQRELAAIAGLAGSDVANNTRARPLFLSAQACKGALELAHAKMTKDRFFQEGPRGLAFENGFVTLTGAQIEINPHAPDNKARFAYQFAYSRDLPCPMWIEFLRTLWEGDDDADAKTSVLQEFLGASLFGIAPRMKRCLMLLGDSNSGKSTLLDVVRDLFPEGSTTAVGLHEMEHEYRRATLAGALLNTVAEVSSQELLQSEAFKAIVAGDVIQARPIYGHPIEFRPRAGHAFAANTLPRVADRSEAIWNRVVLLTFNRCFCPEPDAGRGQVLAKQGLAHELVEKEKAAIVAWAAVGLERLVANGWRYTIPSSSSREVALWRHDSDPLEVFVDEELELIEGRKNKAHAIYRAYDIWCDGANVTRKLTRPNFTKQLKRVLARRMGGPVKTTLVKGYTVIHGVAILRPDPYLKDVNYGEITN